LRAERAAERRREVARPDAEDHVAASVVDLEPLDIERPVLEVGRRRVGVVARPVVVTLRIRDVEQQCPGDDVEHDGPLLVGRCAARADGHDVEDGGPTRDRDDDAERTIAGGRCRDDGRG
jgi:hypothetical protein